MFTLLLIHALLPLPYISPLTCPVRVTELAQESSLGLGLGLGLELRLFFGLGKGYSSASRPRARGKARGILGLGLY